MWKLIFLGLLIWLVFSIFKRIVISNKNSQSRPDKPHMDGDTAENMVQCATCQVHLPRSEAFLVDGNFYCSKAHIEKK